MGRTPTGIPSKIVGISMKQDMADEIERRAKSMRLSTGAYIKIILGQWLDSGKKVTLQEG